MIAVSESISPSDLPLSVVLEYKVKGDFIMEHQINLPHFESQS